MKKASHVMYWIARVVAAVIMLQTLYFKFTAAPESVHIFTTVGMEPWGRIGVGVMELIAACLLMINATAWIGAFLGAGLMTGAIFLHLTFLGISVDNDDGYLFVLACTVLVACTFVLYVNRQRMADLVRSYH